MPRVRTKPPSNHDVASRTARSTFQAGLVTALILLINLAVEPDLTADQVQVISLVALPIFVYLMNALEDASGVAVLGKKPPAPAADTLTAEELAAVRTALASRDEPRIRTLQADAPPRVERFRG